MAQFKHFTEASFWCVKNCSQASVAGISPVLSLASVPGLTTNTEASHKHLLSGWMRGGKHILCCQTAEKIWMQGTRIKAEPSRMPYIKSWFSTWQGLESPWKHVPGCFQKDLTEERSVGGPISWTRSQGGVKVRVFPEHQHLLLCFQAVHAMEPVASPSFLHSFPTMICTAPSNWDIK